MQASGSAVRVARRAPRSRSVLEGLAGRLEVALVADSYLHVGSGVQRVSVPVEEVRSSASRARTRRELEDLVARLSGKIELDYAQPVYAGGRLVVPGSSVKGNVRSRLELSFKPKNGVARSCLIRATEGPVAPPKKGEQGWRHFRVWEASLSYPGREACEYSEDSPEVCLLCDIFGTAGLQGLVYFGDLVAARAETERVELYAGEKLLAVKPGGRFEGAVTFRNLKPAELGLLLYGMGFRDGRMGRQVLLGKHKYSSPGERFGVVHFELEGLALAPFSEKLEVGGASLAPGSRASGAELDRLVSALVGAARSEFGDELLDVDEVGAVESLAGA
ncbi:RAMP superfamily CRISPR-associated protein [Thermofilum pendens]|uniref:CRISPR type III-associated protein domain-containing protein n=1 Tax=Thermofilum pendens (strain DSM 2475 / Hrk 5) TaxID=368408 RepID=A1RZQ7_THEPD|nr:RAMP superfamily CRISPR-associated protein [Thermofilum pendens]ABL78687.1 hypothetical protein Tpen_1289 [Thermofilum pendens Hrk 5]